MQFTAFSMAYSKAHRVMFSLETRSQSRAMTSIIPIYGNAICRIEDTITCKVVKILPPGSTAGIDRFSCLSIAYAFGLFCGPQWLEPSLETIFGSSNQGEGKGGPATGIVQSEDSFESFGSGVAPDGQGE